jgi:hypothetical protein
VRASEGGAVPEVLVERVVHRSAAHFERGRREGLRLMAHGTAALVAVTEFGLYESPPIPLPFAATHLG